MLDKLKTLLLGLPSSEKILLAVALVVVISPQFSWVLALAIVAYFTYTLGKQLIQ